LEGAFRSDFTGPGQTLDEELEFGQPDGVPFVGGMVIGIHLGVVEEDPIGAVQSSQEVALPLFKLILGMLAGTRKVIDDDVIFF
jgi:hypothetical protein